MQPIGTYAYDSVGSAADGQALAPPVFRTPADCPASVTLNRCPSATARRSTSRRTCHRRGVCRRSGRRSARKGGVAGQAGSGTFRAVRPRTRRSRLIARPGGRSVYRAATCTRSESEAREVDVLGEGPLSEALGRIEAFPNAQMRVGRDRSELQAKVRGREREAPDGPARIGQGGRERPARSGGRRGLVRAPVGLRPPESRRRRRVDLSPDLDDAVNASAREDGAEVGVGPREREDRAVVRLPCPRTIVPRADGRRRRMCDPHVVVERSGGEMRAARAERDRRDEVEVGRRRAAARKRSLQRGTACQWMRSDALHCGSPCARGRARGPLNETFGWRTARRGKTGRRKQSRHTLV